MQDPSLVKIHSGITVEPEELKVNNSNSSIEADSIQETKHTSIKVLSEKEKERTLEKMEEPVPPSERISGKKPHF